MRLEELDFDIPEELIAQEPLEPRDSCRLLHLTATGQSHHRRFSSLPDILRPGDTLVFNDSRVLPARIEGRRATGGRVELLFLRPTGQNGGTRERWEALARPSQRLRAGEEVSLPNGQTLRLDSRVGHGRWIVEGPPSQSLVTLMEEHGRLPLPPYIKTYPAEPGSYQTVYAATPGSAAAPTAGLHFTSALDAALADAGVTVETVTLHVGLGTFRPLDEETLAAEQLHSEAYAVDAAVWARLRVARAQGRRVVAVGTTSLRTLEHLARATTPSGASPALLRGDTSLFVTPGFEFRVVDALITNFHLPRTSLLALVMAFCGVAETRLLYRHAVTQRYRFYSFGDAMLAL